ncbi:MAG: 4Fe-4S binding protein [Saprospiraceae bacterium]|nr:4Fe-4S binding protein [Saprospiraceae bacterium]
MSERSPVLFNIGWNACINCGACVAICPQPEPFISPFDTISVDRPCDIACMLCESICPVTTIDHVAWEGTLPQSPLNNRSHHT